MEGGPDSGDTVPKTTSGQIENNDSRCHVFGVFTFFVDITTSVNWIS